MARRDKAVALSVVHAIVRNDSRSRSVVARFYAYFCLYWLNLEKLCEDVFTALRAAWEIDDDAYVYSFDAGDGAATPLRSIGEQGYSGSTFFVTTNASYVIKSIPRHFEYSFFKNDLMAPYADYMRHNSASLLCRITDFLESTHWSLGTLLGLAPTHHIVMENILFGQGEDDAEWEHWDLKPVSYFFPERDVGALNMLTSEATKNKLADDFRESILLDLNQAEEFNAQLQKDTAFLANHNSVDYSLFLIRIPYSEAADPASSTGANSVAPAGPPFIPPKPPSWRTGIRSADGKHVYRAAILDFFWATHKVHAKAMTGLINAYNLFDRKGPMSVTTDSPEYRGRFLKMCSNMIEVLPNEAASAN